MCETFKTRAGSGTGTGKWDKNSSDTINVIAFTCRIAKFNARATCSNPPRRGRAEPLHFRTPENEMREKRGSKGIFKGRQQCLRYKHVNMNQILRYIKMAYKYDIHDSIKHQDRA